MEKTDRIGGEEFAIVQVGAAHLAREVCEPRVSTDSAAQLAADLVLSSAGALR
ncbi:MAG: hypothetical protein ABIY55_13735 [Kofleriaceae bacterium]